MPPRSSWAPGPRPGSAGARYRADRPSGSRRAWSGRAPSRRRGSSRPAKRIPHRRAEKGRSAGRRRSPRAHGRGERGGERALTSRVLAARSMRLCGSVRLQVLLHHRVELRLRVVAADQFLGDLAVLEEQEPRDGDDAVFLRDVLLGVDVELPDLQLALVLLGQLIDGRRQGLAGTAPGGPELDQARYLGAEHLRLEVVIAERRNVVGRHSVPPYSC